MMSHHSAGAVDTITIHQYINIHISKHTKVPAESWPHVDAIDAIPIHLNSPSLSLSTHTHTCIYISTRTQVRGESWPQCIRGRRNYYLPDLSLSLYTHTHTYIFLHVHKYLQLLTTVAMRQTQLLPTWSLSLTPPDFSLSLHTHTYTYTHFYTYRERGITLKGESSWFLSLSTHTYIYIHTFLYIQRAGNYVKRGNLRYVKIWKLLHTRQEVYHPLQEVCPLDRANLLRANLE